ncbi:DUF6417 family protein [Streptomyces rishiriensis]|uniref:DUF6417 family protein n=1 Tax=Streptomyces rishiriensis TaxID=68264 RepID=UPI0037B7FE17
MPVGGLAERVRAARREQGTNRHVLHLSQEQMESVASGFWLHKMSGSALEANRLARDYGIAHDAARYLPAPYASHPGGECALTPGRSKQPEPFTELCPGGQS